jgi:hypothetical protein
MSHDQKLFIHMYAQFCPISSKLQIFSKENQIVFKVFKCKDPFMPFITFQTIKVFWGMNKMNHWNEPTRTLVKKYPVFLMMYKLDQRYYYCLFDTCVN